MQPLREPDSDNSVNIWSKRVNILGEYIKDSRKNFGMVEYYLKFMEPIVLELGEDRLTREMGALSKLRRDQDQRCKDPGMREPKDILTKSSMCGTGHSAPGLPVLESVGTVGHLRRTDCSGSSAPGGTTPDHAGLFQRRGGPMCSEATAEAV